MVRIQRLYARVSLDIQDKTLFLGHLPQWEAEGKGPMATKYNIT